MASRVHGTEESVVSGVVEMVGGRGNKIDKKDEETKLDVFHLSIGSMVTLLLLWLTNFCAGCSFSILSPFFPQEAEKKGMSQTATAFVFSSYQLVSFVSVLLYGNYMVHIGAKFLYVSGILVASVCSVLFGLLDKSPPGITFAVLAFICRWFESVSVSAYITSGFAIISSEFPQHLSTVFGITETGIALGLMAGPALGGVLNEVGGFGMPFFVVGGLILLIGCSVILLLPTPRDIPQKRQGSILTLLRSALVWEAIQAVFMSILGITFLEPVFSIYLEQFNLSSTLIGLMFVILPGLYGITSPLWGYLSDKMDLTEVLIVCSGIPCAIGYMLIGSSPILTFLPVNLWITICGLAIYGISCACMYVIPIRCLLMGAVELGFENNMESIGLTSGLFNAAAYLGAFSGPTLSGLIVQVVGFRWATSVLAGLFFLSSLYSALYFLLRYLNKRRQPVKLYEHDERTGLNSTTVRPTHTHYVTTALQ